MSTCPSASACAVFSFSRAGAEAREHLDAHREGGEALAEGLEMLERKHRRRHEHARPACPALTTLKAARRATSVLPKPTSPQTRRSIGSLASRSRLHFADGALLINRLLVRERVRQRVVPRGVLAVTGADGRLAGGVEFDQVVGQIEHRPLDAALGARPLAAAEFMHRRLRAARLDRARRGRSDRPAHRGGPRPRTRSAGTRGPRRSSSA